MKGKTKKKASRVFFSSFFLTLLVLSLAVATLYFLGSQSTVQHLPALYDFEKAEWMKYVSPGAEKISIMNFSNTFIKTGNYTFFPSLKLLAFYNFTVEIDIRDTQF